jgi:hypothetical protein
MHPEGNNMIEAVQRSRRASAGLQELELLRREMEFFKTEDEDQGQSNIPLRTSGTEMESNTKP